MPGTGTKYVNSTLTRLTRAGTRATVETGPGGAAARRRTSWRSFCEGCCSCSTRGTESGEDARWLSPPPRQQWQHVWGRQQHQRRRAAGGPCCKMVPGWQRCRVCLRANGNSASGGGKARRCGEWLNAFHVRASNQHCLRSTVNLHNRTGTPETCGHCATLLNFNVATAKPTRCSRWSLQG